MSTTFLSTSSSRHEACRKTLRLCEGSCPEVHDRQVMNILPLRKAVFQMSVDRSCSVALDIMVSQEALTWIVSSDDRSNEVAVEFSNRDQAVAEWTRRAGELVLRGGHLIKHLYYGDIRGSYNGKPVRILPGIGTDDPVVSDSTSARRVETEDEVPPGSGGGSYRTPTLRLHDVRESGAIR